ncbi:HAD-IIIC family phosphatase [Streptomyces atroolivaceus]|uniref:HAD-IIIC family phosphatase n=1 Tax=Streptomyces atroolivaceus TaxID=66869 RepID=A0ABV9VDF7_STRAZ|nr:HAD-IIIC family phosphatase [Streptomyces atroolivaceus]
MVEKTDDTLRSLHERGRVAAEYPRVRGLVRGAGVAETRWAGNLLARIGADAVLAEHPDTPVVSVAFTGHSTVSGLVAPVTAELARHGLLLRPHVSDFDGYVFDLSDTASELYSAKPDAVVCLLDASVVFDEVPVPWEPEDVRRIFDEKLTLLDGLATSFAGAGQGTLVFNTLPLPREWTAQLIGVRDRARLGAVWREANARLLRLMDRHPALTVLDFDPLLGADLPLRDDRLGVYTHTEFSPEAHAAYARDVAHLLRAATGRAKKCLVLDLDNTVWGGILGDDGIEGIEVAGSYRGEAFRRLQRTARQVASQGVLLAAVSKNDLDPVREVLRSHPDMTLREDDFVRVVANWRPKHDNLRELAAELNLGVDSFVFADDSPYECGLVVRELPDVAVVALDEEPALHVEKLLRDGWFDVRDITVDDLKRPERYREELDRKDFLHGFSSLDDYLRELDVQVRFADASPAELARVSQLTLRTNQFNLTTERLQQSEVAERAAAPGSLVLTIRSGDRFGDNGVVGAVLAHREGDELVIDNFLLSCRVFARGIEQACLSAVLGHARDQGLRSVRAGYRPSAKNGKVQDFYPGNGFRPAGGGTDGAPTLYRHDLAEIPAPPDHIRLTLSLGGLHQ